MAINFDGATKTINLSLGTLTLDVKDLYSRWKDWVQLADNAKWLPAFSSLGGDPIDPTAGTSVPLYAFLINGWRIRPQEASHTLNVAGGILLVDGGGDPFLNTLGSFVVRVNYQQPVQAITVATGGGGGGGLTAAQVWQYLIGEGWTAEQLVRILLAAAAGKLSGAAPGSTEIRIRDTTDSKDRIVATVDANGNRLNVVLDAN